MAKNAYFQIVLKDEGTYIKFVPAEMGGKSLSYDVVAAYLAKKRIDYDIKMVGDAIATLTEPKEFRLNFNRGMVENEYLSIEVDSNRLTATGIFYPPSSGGKLMTKQDIISDLVHVGIKCGVDEALIERFLEDRQYCTELILANSVLPVQGKNAEIQYTFVKDNFGKPKINEDGTVDFHQLDMISHVDQGDVLAVLTPADPGKPGIDIFGNIIRQAKVVNKILRHGINIHLSEDKTIMYSDVSGHVTLTEDKVFVSDTYEVPADVGVASGDIDYNGNVLVRGNVVTGFMVKASGDIIVEGVVEGATLIAGGQIVLKRGIQGKSRGQLISKGNITARFLESCEVKSDGDVVTDAIMHSNVYAKGDIKVTGKKGLMVGGNIKSGTSISAKTIGTAMGIQMKVSIGIDDAIIKENTEIEKAIEEMKVEMAKLAQLFALLKKRVESGHALSDSQKMQLVTAKQSFATMQEDMKQKAARQTILKAEIDSFKDGRIKFTGSVFPGVLVEISNSSMYVKSEVKYGQFVRDKADIRVMAI